jgi:hypothetical protein
VRMNRYLEITVTGLRNMVRYLDRNQDTSFYLCDMEAEERRCTFCDVLPSFRTVRGVDVRALR